MTDDIHRKRASRIFGVPEEQVTEEQRAKAKTFNHQSVYGDQMDIEAEAERISANILTHRLAPRKYSWAPDRCDACGVFGDRLKEPCPIPGKGPASQQKGP